MRQTRRYTVGTMSKPRPERRPDPAPMEFDEVRLIGAGIALWVVALILTLVFRGTLCAHGHGDWSWICAAGIGGGLLGMWYCHRRRQRLRHPAP